MKPTFSPFLGTFASGHSWLLSTLMVFWGTLLFLLVWFTSLTLALRLWMKTHMEVSSQPLPWISCPWVFFMNYLRIIDNWTWPNRSVLHGRHKKHTICHLHTLKKTQKQLKFILHSLWQIMYVYLNLKCLTLFPLEHTCHMKTIGPFFFFFTRCRSSFGLVLWGAVTWAAAPTPPGSFRSRHFGWGRFGHWDHLHFFLSFDCGLLLAANIFF